MKGSSNPLITQGDLKAYKIIIPDIKTMKYFNEKAQKIMFNFDLMNKEIDLIVKLNPLANVTLGNQPIFNLAFFIFGNSSILIPFLYLSFPY